MRVHMNLCTYACVYIRTCVCNTFPPGSKNAANVIWHVCIWCIHTHRLMQRSNINMLNKNSLGLLKKGVAKQSRIKSIAWHLKWLVRTRADIGLQPSGLVRSRTDIKLQPSELVRSRINIKLRPSAFVRTRTDFKLLTV